ncbi:MAG TPA: substrate-binding domain-containing protein [Candidatus Dormibacteraeota bacterium]|nr:substrate-binding domain-containing protein [Candidatus Dormibacteraeota bacterium]
MKLGRIAALFILAVSVAACGGGPTSQVVPGKKVALLLPESAPARYESQDLPLFRTKLQALCADCTVLYQNAGGDAATQRSQADAVIAAGANVLVLDPVDPSAGFAIASTAASHHVPVVAYDRLVMNVSSVRYYVGFDDAAIGTLQGTALLAALKGSHPAVVMLNGDPADRDATALKKAVHTVIDGKVVVAREFDTPASSSDAAQAEMTQALTGLSGKVDGVYAANDEMASGALAAIKAAKLTTTPPITGGDSELGAVQRIVAGDQYMTVYRPVRQEAEAAAQLAYDLAYGVGVAPAVTGGNTMDNGAVQVPAVLVQPVAVTRRTVLSTVIADGFWTRAQICTADYAAACRAAGLS